MDTLNQDIENLGKVALRVKADRDELLETLKAVDMAITLEMQLATGALRGSEAWATLQRDIRKTIEKAEKP